MALIAKQIKTKRDTLSLRLDRDVHLTLKQRSEFLGSSQDHVIRETLRYFFRRDKEFAAWQAGRTETAAQPEPASERTPKPAKGRAAETA